MASLPGFSGYPSRGPGEYHRGTQARRPRPHTLAARRRLRFGTAVPERADRSVLLTDPSGAGARSVERAGHLQAFTSNLLRLPFVKLSQSNQSPGPAAKNCPVCEEFGDRSTTHSGSLGFSEVLSVRLIMRRAIHESELYHWARAS